METVREREDAGRPREGGSAKFSKEGTYNEDTQRLCWDNRVVIRCRTVFCCGLRDFPPSIA